MTTTTPTRHAPGPKGHPVLGFIPELNQDALGFLLGLRRDYGDVVRFRIGPAPVYLVSHPDLVKGILQDNNTDYHKDIATDKIKTLLGLSLLTGEGEFWLKQRRLIQPLFHRQRIASFATTMTDATTRMLDKRWQGHAQRREPLDIAKEMMHLTLDIVGWTLFSTDVTKDADRIGNALSAALVLAMRKLRAIIDLPEFVPTPTNRQYQQAKAVLDDVIYGLIRSRRESGEDAGDLLSMLMNTRDEDTGEGMSERQIRNEAMTFFVAGHETTSNALTWTFHLLAQHPEVRTRLEQEVDEALAGRTPTAEDVAKLPYTRRVLEESMRLYPPAWAIGRKPLKPITIGGYDVPKGSNIIMSTYVVHRHPDFWDEPERFDPDRFLPERAQGRHRYAYIPFGGGPRLCIGSNFAMMEAQLILATITQRYRLEHVPNRPVLAESLITLRPKHGLPMTLTPRTSRLYP